MDDASDVQPLDPAVAGAGQAMADLQARVAALVTRLARQADEAVAKKILIERRWEEDLRQYHGRYDPETERALAEDRRSRVYQNQTGPKTRTWRARLSDLLFPTDERNWAIRPTPVPELTDAAKAAMRRADAGIAEANAAASAGDPRHVAMARQAQAHADAAATLRADMAEAARRAERMEALIADQLTECRYNIACREALDDAVMLGAGILKGPIRTGRSRRSWQQHQPGVFVLAHVDDPQPAAVRVDPWSFFPDPNAMTIDDAEYFFERHLMTATDLRRLAKRPGFDGDAIRRLLRTGSRDTVPTYVGQIRTITDGAAHMPEDRFHVWEYHGALTAEDMTDLFLQSGNISGAADYMDVDPLTEIGAIIWFCQGEVLKFGIHILDSVEPIYSVYPFVREEASVWGRGVPSLMRDSQAALNAAWRMMLDNGGLSTGPQIVIDRDSIEPANGKWEIEPRKVWWRTKPLTGQQTMRAAFETYGIDSRQGELANIINLSKQFLDDETSLPVIAQGEQGAHTTQTANGMAMLQNAANVIFRDAVKNFDDFITVPLIRRFYDFNMQFSDREDVKGDFEVDARGSAVLLVREIQAQNLMQVASAFVGHPVIGPLLEVAPLVRKTFQAHMLSADELVKSDDTLEQEAARQAEQQPQPDPAVEVERMRIEAQDRLAQFEAQARLQVAQIQQQTRLAELAAQQNIKVEELRARLGMEGARLDHAERTMAAEIGFKARQTRIKRRTGIDIPDGTRFPP